MHAKQKDPITVDKSAQIILLYIKVNLSRKTNEKIAKSKQRATKKVSKSLNTNQFLLKPKSSVAERWERSTPTHDLYGLHRNFDKLFSSMGTLWKHPYGMLFHNSPCKSSFTDH